MDGDAHGFEGVGQLRLTGWDFIEAAVDGVLSFAAHAWPQVKGCKRAALSFSQVFLVQMPAQGIFQDVFAGGVEFSFVPDDAFVVVALPDD